LSLQLLTDVHVRRAIVVALRIRDVDVLTAQADESADVEDPDLFDRAMFLGRVDIGVDRKSFSLDVSPKAKL